MQMKIFFDSNVWRPIVTPKKFPNEKSINDFELIRQFISLKKITAFISKTTFTLEAIRKNDRKNVFGNRHIIGESVGEHSNEKVLKNKIKLGGSFNTDFSSNPVLKEHFIDAKKIGFEIVSLPRLGMLNNSDINSLNYYQFSDTDAFWSYANAASKIVEEIEDRRAGKYHFDKISQKYDPVSPKGILKAPIEDSQLISKAVAEWADGDSVSSSIAIGCDYFCTRDYAKGAGDSSIFSKRNLEWLSETYGFRAISPEELATILRCDQQ